MQQVTYKDKGLYNSQFTGMFWLVTWPCLEFQISYYGSCYGHCCHRTSSMETYLYSEAATVCGCEIRQCDHTMYHIMILDELCAMS